MEQKWLEEGEIYKIVGNLEKVKKEQLCTVSQMKLLARCLKQKKVFFPHLLDYSSHLWDVSLYELKSNWNT